MIILKITLYTVIFLTSSLLGFSMGSKYAKRVKNLMALQQSIRLLQAEVIVFANPIPFALKNISSRVSTDIQVAYQSISNCIEKNQSGDLYNCFLQATDHLRNRCMLKEQDIDVFLALGKVIGKTDRMDQELQFKYTLKEMEELILEAKEEKNKNEKMYRSLGVLMGLGMIIILI